MEPIAGEVKAFLGTLGFNIKRTRVDIKYSRKKDDNRLYAYITAEGPIDE